MDIQTIISSLFIAFGAIFLLIAAIGVVKFPDFYTRLHAAGIGDTLGAFLLTLGIMVKAGFTLLSLKVFLVFLLYLLTNPLGTNLIILAAVHAKDYQGYNRKKVQNPMAKVLESNAKLDSDEAHICEDIEDNNVLESDKTNRGDEELENTEIDKEEKGEEPDANTAAGSNPADGTDSHHAGSDIQ